MADDRNPLQRAGDKIKDALSGDDLERDLENVAGGMAGAGPAFHDAGVSPATGPGGMVPDVGGAAGGSLTDEEPVGYADDRGLTPE